ncbi:membrane protein ORF12 [Anguillid herpesvirus 1]|uniref:Membrane protein ORF12 n=2 Tax=Anguillid herpesvirus 1 TaxID=150286 RepID=A0A1J0RE50_9VIRU
MLAALALLTFCLTVSAQDLADVCDGKGVLRTRHDPVVVQLTEFIPTESVLCTSLATRNRRCNWTIVDGTIKSVSFGLGSSLFYRIIERLKNGSADRLVLAEQPCVYTLHNTPDGHHALNVSHDRRATMMRINGAQSLVFREPISVIVVNHTHPTTLQFGYSENGRLGWGKECSLSNDHTRSTRRPTSTDEPGLDYDAEAAAYIQTSTIVMCVIWLSVLLMAIAGLRIRKRRRTFVPSYTFDQIDQDTIEEIIDGDGDKTETTNV